MRIETALGEYIASLPAVVALVEDRVWVDKAPDNPVFPFVRINFIDNEFAWHFRGPGGLERVRLQIDVFAKVASGVDQYATASEVLAAVEGDGLGPLPTGVLGLRGPIGSPGVVIRGIFPDLRHGGYDPEELQAVRMSRDVRISYRVPLP